MWEIIKRLLKGEDVDFEWSIELGVVDVIFILALLIMIIVFLISL